MLLSAGYFDRFLNMRQVLSILEFWKYQGFEYANVWQGAGYIWISLNNS